jgi:hypothetical protein
MRLIFALCVAVLSLTTFSTAAVACESTRGTRCGSDAETSPTTGLQWLYGSREQGEDILKRYGIVLHGGKDPFVQLEWYFKEIVQSSNRGNQTYLRLKGDRPDLPFLEGAFITVRKVQRDLRNRNATPGWQLVIYHTKPSEPDDDQAIEYLFDIYPDAGSNLENGPVYAYLQLWPVELNAIFELHKKNNATNWRQFTP